MLRYVRQKIKNKIWLTLCLVLGLSFLVAALSCQPMFEMGSLDKMLLDSFYEKGVAKNCYPLIIGRAGSYETEKRNNVDSVAEGIRKYSDTWGKYFEDLPTVQEQTKYSLHKETCRGEFGNKGVPVLVSYMPQMLSHSQILDGTSYEAYEEAHGLTDGIPCIMSERLMDKQGLVTGERLEFLNWKTASGETLKLVVCGVFKEQDEKDLFWYMQPADFEQELFMSKENFDYIAANYESERIYYNHYELLDYTCVTHKNAEEFLENLREFEANDKYFTQNFSDVLEQYVKDKRMVGITLWVMELPMLGLVLAFIYMVSCQIIDTEKPEIAQLRSRGYTKGKVILLYLLQSVLLAGVSLLLGIFFGFFLCKMAAGTTDFLSFGNLDVSMYRFDWRMLLYGLLAAGLGIVCVLLPVFANSGVTIVEQKASGGAKKKMLWEKYFFDVALLAASLYLLHNFKKELEEIRMNALVGSKMDPLIFLDSVLFIVALGLFLLRLVHYLVRLVYHLGRKRWKPATYASFLQITRNFSKQGFISVFMILTVALGLFNANAARTINQNHEDRIVYENGADFVVREKWNMRVFALSGPTPETDYEYLEPDYGKYNALLEQGLVENMTRVMPTNNVDLVYGGKRLSNFTVMGIHTREFGETASLKDELNKEAHWYTYLNELAQNGDGIIVSKNLAEELGLEVGSVIKFTRYGDIAVRREKERGSMQGKVVAIVDDWPGYNRYYYEDGEEKENYLVVTNYARMVQDFQISPYEIWLRPAAGVSAQEISDALSDMGVKLDYVKSVEEDVRTMKESAMIRITNGMFTLSFLIAIILCGVGFLIYWISSIRQRELLLGVYRAMGMSVSEINKMLINEHIFSTAFSVLSGGICGVVATLLFVKLFGVIYLPEKSNLDIYIYYQAGDVVKLFAVVLLMILFCLMILRRLVKSMNITQALKLGEE